MQKSALRKELINQPDFVFTSLRPTNKFVCVVLQKQKDADNIVIDVGQTFWGYSDIMNATDFAN